MKRAEAVRALLPAVAVTLLVVAAAVAAEFSELQLGKVDRPESDLAGQAEPATDEPLLQPPAIDLKLPWQERVVGQGILVVVLGAVLLVVLLVVLVVVLRVLARQASRRRLRPLRAVRSGSAPDEPDEEQLLAAVDAGLENLSDDDRDSRRAVIVCWLRLEEAVAAAGTPRHDSDTATDLVVRLLRSHQISEPVLGGLAEVYLLARFATHTVDERMRKQARAALHRLREELAGAVSAR